MEDNCTFSDDNKNCSCILHCNKDDWFVLKEDGSKDWSKSREDRDRFWEKIQEQLKCKNSHEYQVYKNNRNSERKYTEYIDFDEPLVYEKIVFPEFQEEIDNRIGKNFYTIDTDENSEQYEVHIFQDKNLEFNECYFCGKTDFKKYTFSKSVKFLNCNFYNNDIDFSNKIFNQSLFFKDCKNIGKLNLHSSRIEGYASFKGSKFNEVEFEKTLFNNIAVFNETTFNSHVKFKYTSFLERVYFQNVTVHGTLNLSSSIFKDEVNFLNLKVKNTTRETARIIKHSFEKINNIIEANKFYALEMRIMRKELKFLKEPLNWIVFFLHWLSSNHSQNYILPLLWIFIGSFLFCDGYNLIQNSFMDSIFSIYYSDIFSCISKSIFIIEKESLTFGTLIYKSIIAYLIYQFIISIRQNTRRK